MAVDLSDQVSRDQLTELFLKLHNMPADPDSIKSYSRTWWWSTRKNRESFRLSAKGYAVLACELNLISYEIKFEESHISNSQFIINLEKYMNCPYYLQQHSIIVFSERKGVELSLIGNIQQFLKNKFQKTH